MKGIHRDSPKFRTYTHKGIETIEYKYFNEIQWCLTNEKNRLLRLLDSKEEIRDSWEDAFKKASANMQPSEMAKGAERIIATFLPNNWLPNSTPIGSDFMFETFDAIVHIDIKTCNSSNRSDYVGKIPFSLNQTSYFHEADNIYGSLPSVYSLNRESNTQTKLCVTFIIQLVYDQHTQKIERLSLVCIPNGKLHKLYGDSVMGRGKGKGSSFRYIYKGNGSMIAKFSTLDQQPSRFELIF